MDRKYARILKDSNSTINQLHLIGIWRTLNTTTEEYILFSSTHGIFTNISHILGHKINLCKFLRTKIIQSMFSDHNSIQLEMNKREIQPEISK